MRRRKFFLVNSMWFSQRQLGQGKIYSPQNVKIIILIIEGLALFMN